MGTGNHCRLTASAVAAEGALHLCTDGLQLVCCPPFFYCPPTPAYAACLPPCSLPSPFVEAHTSAMRDLWGTPTINQLGRTHSTTTSLSTRVLLYLPHTTFPC